MEKRLLLALVLSLLVVTLFSYFQESPPEESEPVDGDTTAAVTRDTEPETPRSPSPDTEPIAAPSPDEPVEGDQPDTVPFRTPKLVGHFSRRGGNLASIRVRDQHRLDAPDRLVDLVMEGGDGLVFDVRYPETGLRRADYALMETADTQSFTFRHVTAEDVVVEKQYRFRSDGPYTLELTISLHNRGDRRRHFDGLSFPTVASPAGAGLRWGPGFGQGRAEKTQFDQVYWYYGKDGSMEYLSPQGGGYFGFLTGGDDDSPYSTVSGPVEWSAVSNRYFIAAVVPETPFRTLFLNTEQGGDTFTAWSAREDFELAPRETKTVRHRLFLGPKRYSTLQSFHPGLESTLNYGWFTILTLPLLIGLRWIYMVIPNYGIAIILLSVLIKVILYPLTKKGLVSMQRMKKLQPKMKEIQEKYEDDREKMNEKLMEFYQENNVNPVGGCLPMLLQLPIFIALYRMLEYSIELRGATFALWVTDLSAPDPYYVLPVLMGVLMFFQQRYTMTATGGGTMGQQQQMMVYFMPIMFVFLFMNFPVGLVLYWMTNSAATVGQYWLINRSMEQEGV